MSDIERTPLLKSKNEIHSVTEPRCERSTWKRLKWWLLPIEILLFLSLFGFYFQTQVNQQYLLQRSARNALDNWTSLNASTDHMCLNQTFVENLTSNKTYRAAQAKASKVNLVQALAFLFPSVIVVLILGPVSDLYGRKPILVIVFMTQTVASCINVLVVYFGWSIWLLVLGSFVTGTCGGLGLMMTILPSYITDVTPQRWLTLRMASMAACLYISTGIGSLTADIWIQKTRCSFKLEVWVVVITSLLGAIYSCVLPESLSREARMARGSVGGFRTLVKGFKIFFIPSYLGVVKFWQVWVAVLVCVLSLINGTGSAEILGYFLHNKPLEWEYSKIGVFNLMTAMAHLVAVVVLMPILVGLKVPDSIVAMIGCVFGCGVSIFMALLRTGPEMFVGKAMYMGCTINDLLPLSSPSSLPLSLPPSLPPPPPPPQLASSSVWKLLLVQLEMLL